MFLSKSTALSQSGFCGFGTSKQAVVLFCLSPHAKLTVSGLHALSETYAAPFQENVNASEVGLTTRVPPVVVSVSLVRA